MEQNRVILFLAAGVFSFCAWAIETGPPDFRITEVGPGLDPSYRAVNPAITHNPTRNEFLVVWSGDGDPLLSALDDEIYAQRLNAGTGLNVGPPVRISRMGPDVAASDPSLDGGGGGSAFFEALDPAVAWSSLSDRYLVVWWGDDDTPPLVDDEKEIFGQLLSGDGSRLGEQFRISSMGTDGDVLAQALSPDVVYNSLANEFFVVFGGDNINGVFANQEFEIWGQRIDAVTGDLIGEVLRVSDMGSEDGNASFTAADARVAFNPESNEYLVAWEGDDDDGGAVDGEVEIYAQRISASTGQPVGENDFRISFFGPEGDTGYDSTNPVPVFNSITGEYLVAWNGIEDSGILSSNDREIYAQRLDSDGTLLGAAHRISSMGPDGVSTYWGINPSLAVRQATGEYLVVWSGEDDAGELVNNKFEVYGRVISPNGQPRGRTYRLSMMGPDNSSQWGVGLPALASRGEQDGFLVVWDGIDDRSGLAPGEIEIFGQFLDADILFISTFE